LLFWQCFLSHTFLLPSFSVLTYQHRLVAWTVVAFVLSREHDSRHWPTAGSTKMISSSTFSMWICFLNG
jgi:hypothetical protein